MFKKVLQIGIVVKDLEATVKNYEEFGLGPWEYFDINKETASNLSLRGTNNDQSFKAATYSVGDVQFELIQPLDAKTIYTEFLKERGEGLHHIAFDIDNYDEVVSLVKSRDGMILQRGTLGDITWSYLSTENDLKMIAEIYEYDNQ